MSTLRTSQLRRQSSTAGVLYSIHFDRENKTYYPGEILSGDIKFQTLSREPLKGLKTRLTGIQKVCWGDNFVASSEEFLTIDEYSPNVENEWEADCEEYTAADYKYRFSFVLPMDTRQSFSGRYGSVKYYVGTVLNEERMAGGGCDDYHRHGLTDQLRGYFQVKSMLDLNTIPDISSPAYMMKDNTSGFTSILWKNKHPIRYILKISKRGFVSSEMLRFSVDINNTSNHSVSGTSIKLIQDITYSGGQITHEDSKTLSQTTGPILSPRSFKTWKGFLEIPDTLTTAKGSSISIKYKLRLTIYTTRFCEKIKGDLPIIIGTIPVEYDDFESPQRSNSFHGYSYGESIGRGKNAPCPHLDLAHRDCFTPTSATPVASPDVFVCQGSPLYSVHIS